MNKKILNLFCLHNTMIFIVVAVIFMAGITHAGESPVKIGVLAKRGPERCLAQWSPTAEYLTATIPGQTFVILPVKFEKISSAVESGEVDFILANSSFYVDLEIRFGVNRIVTMKNKHLNGAHTTFGGVIFCKKTGMTFVVYLISEVKPLWQSSRHPLADGKWPGGS